MSVIIDIVLVLIVLYFIWRGYRNGLIISVLGIVTMIASFAAANIVANTYSGEFTGVLQPFMSGIVDNAVSDKSANDLNGDGIVSPEERGDVYNVTFNALRGLGISEDVSEKIAEQMTGRAGSTTERLTESLTNFLCEKIAFLVVFVVVFILASIIFAAIGNLINLAFMLPGLELLNHIGGAVLGLAKGILLLLFIACIFRYIGMIIPENTLENTFLLEWLVNSNKLADIIGI